MRTSLAPQVIGRCRSRAIRSLSGLRLVVDRLVATKARTAPPQVASERVAAGRNFLWNHNHARDVRWVGRSSLPTDFPDPDRPCERNPGPPTGVSSLTMARARKKSHARFGLTPGGQDRRPGQGRDGEARGRLLPRSGEPHADAAALMTRVNATLEIRASATTSLHSPTRGGPGRR
jgi:hypothetical protein